MAFSSQFITIWRNIINRLSIPGNCKKAGPNRTLLEERECQVVSLTNINNADMKRVVHFSILNGSKKQVWDHNNINYMRKS